MAREYVSEGYLFHGSFWCKRCAHGRAVTEGEYIPHLVAADRGYRCINPVHYPEGRKAEAQADPASNPPPECPKG
jgi:hypothetical protein